MQLLLRLTIYRASSFDEEQRYTDTEVHCVVEWSGHYVQGNSFAVGAYVPTIGSAKKAVEVLAEADHHRHSVHYIRKMVTASSKAEKQEAQGATE